MKPSERPSYVESPIFDERYGIGDNTPIVGGAVCPIDKTPLISVIEYDFSHFRCCACGAIYKWGDKNPDSLREQARGYVSGLIEKLDGGGILLKDVEKTEAIIAAALSVGIVGDFVEKK